MWTWESETYFWILAFSFFNWKNWGRFNISIVCVWFSSVQLLSCVWLFATPWTTAHQASLSITNCQSLPKPMSIESVIPSNHLILCCPLLQHHSSKASILWYSAFFTVQLSQPYMTTGKNIALTRWTFVGKVMSLLFHMLSKLVISFLPRSKHLLTHGCSHHLQWFWSPEK